MTARVSLRVSVLAMMTVAAFWWTACSEPGATADCDQQTCPAGQICQAGVCSAAAAPGGTGELGRYTAVALAADDLRVIATWDATYANLVLRQEQPDGSFDSRTIGGWTVGEDGGIIDTDQGQWAAIAVDTAGQVHLTWYDATEGALLYGRAQGQGPVTVETVDGKGEGARGTHASLAVDLEGGVHIAYRDETARRLRYAHRATDGTWMTEKIDGCAGEDDCPAEGEEDYGEYASLALVSGRPRIAFYDRARGDLKLAEGDSEGGWEVVTLDGRDPLTGVDEGDMGRFASLALDPSQKLGVAYYDATRGALRYLWPGAASPQPVVVDAGAYLDDATGAARQHPVGQHVVQRLDERGRAQLLYLDAGRLVMKRAIVTGKTVEGPWDLAEVPAGAWADFRLASDGRLLGALGVWLRDGTTRTRLETFELGAEAAP